MSTVGTSSAESPLPGKQHVKRLLPPSLASSTPHGPINKLERSAGEQAALDKRKHEILKSMNKEQIDAAYSGQAVKINEHLQRKVKKHAEIDAQLTQLKAEHEMEMRVIKASLNRQDEKRDDNTEDLANGRADTETENDAQLEGEVEMTG